MARRIPVRALADRAGVSVSMLYRVEAGEFASTQTAVRIAHALGRRAELLLIDPRTKADARPALSGDPVHSAMGEFEAGHLRQRGIPVGVDEPYQHYQFAGRADVLAWDLEAAALLHIENRTRFPNLQEMAGSFNAKRAYLGRAIGERLGVRRWASETHVIAALWSAEVLHVLRLRTETFHSICPDSPDAFNGWWQDARPRRGATATLIVVDPAAAGHKRQFIGLDAALSARPRYRGYADAAGRLMHGAAA